MSELGYLAAVVAATLVLSLGPAFAAAWLLVWRNRMARARRRSPLTGELLRAPGQALSERLIDMRMDVAFEIGILVFVPVFPLAYFFLHQAVVGRPVSMRVLGIVMIGALAFVGQRTWAMLKRSAEMDHLRLGLDAEIAAGQELQQLMRQGAAGFHDFPAEKFNIDHVVIAPQGVFAVETKGYSKPNRNGGAADATVVFDGRALAFPDWSTNKPIEQADRQARWLTDWLLSATGEPVRVTPVLALPGWFVERKGRGEVMVLSGKELQAHLLKARTAKPLGPEQMRRVIHQVEQRCRNVEPSYRQDDEQR